MPLMPPIDITAFESSASSFPKTGSPNPIGTLWIVHSKTAPIESPSFIISFMYFNMFSGISFSLWTIEDIL